MLSRNREKINELLNQASENLSHYYTYYIPNIDLADGLDYESHDSDNGMGSDHIVHDGLKQFPLFKDCLKKGLEKKYITMTSLNDISLQISNPEQIAWLNSLVGVLDASLKEQPPVKRKKLPTELRISMQSLLTPLEELNSIFNQEKNFEKALRKTGIQFFNNEMKEEKSCTSNNSSISVPDKDPNANMGEENREISRLRSRTAVLENTVKLQGEALDNLQTQFALLQSKFDELSAQSNITSSRSPSRRF